MGEYIATAAPSGLYATTAVRELYGTSQRGAVSPIVAMYLPKFPSSSTPIVYLLGNGQFVYSTDIQIMTMDQINAGGSDVIWVSDVSIETEARQPARPFPPPPPPRPSS